MILRFVRLEAEDHSEGTLPQTTSFNTMDCSSQAVVASSALSSCVSFDTGIDKL